MMGKITPKATVQKLGSTSVLLGDAMKLIAKIGGYLGRNSDPPPGHQLLWQGYREFQFMCLGFELLDDG
jgi:hypothetical protein